jgi:deoxyribose-phosphate aldolase
MATSKPPLGTEADPTAGAAAPERSTTRAARNPGIPLDPGWVGEAQVDTPALERDAAAAIARLDARGDGDRLLDIVRLLDLTSLSDGDTAESIRILCARAREPLEASLTDVAGIPRGSLHVAAVCVFDRFVPVAVDALQGSEVRVAAVTAGFPLPLTTLAQRAAQIRSAVADGAHEVDVVVTRDHVLSARWEALYSEVRTLREACGRARIKTILATGSLETLDNVARASLVCMMAGADFLKTSTGREQVNATIPVGLTMARAVRAYRERTGHAVGLKPAGGIRLASQAREWLHIVVEELGTAWLEPDRFRIGASALLEDVTLRIRRAVSGPSRPVTVPTKRRR